MIPIARPESLAAVARRLLDLLDSKHTVHRRVLVMCLASRTTATKQIAEMILAKGVSPLPPPRAVSHCWRSRFALSPKLPVCLVSSQRGYGPQECS